MSRDFWLAFWFFLNVLCVLVESACGMIWMPIFNILAAIYILDVILDFDAWALEDLKRPVKNTMPMCQKQRFSTEK